MAPNHKSSENQILAELPMNNASSRNHDSPSRGGPQGIAKSSLPTHAEQADPNRTSSSVEAPEQDQLQSEDPEDGYADEAYSEEEADYSEDEYADYDALDYSTSRGARHRTGHRREPILKGQRNARLLERRQNGALTRG